jgi:hypothetical protein
MWDHAKQMFIESLDHTLASGARLLPGLLAMLSIVAATAAIAMGVRLAIQRVLAGVSLDRRFHQWGFARIEDSLPQGSPTVLLARIGSWAVLVSGSLVGLAIFEPTSPLAYRLLAYVPQVLMAVFVFGVGLGVARFLERTVLVGAVNMGLQSARLVSLGVKWLVLLAATAITLDHLAIGGLLVTLSFAILFGGIVLALALAFGLGSRDAVSRSWERREQERVEPARMQVRHL